ncbi:MAG: hydroxyacid oxidase 1, partial [Planctomycetota bacterium]
MTDFTSVLNVEAFEAAAARNLPKVAYDYYRSGAWGENTLAENIAAWQRLWLRPRCMVDVSKRDAGITLLGQRLPA